jgi:hypothetical protein
MIMKAAGVQLPAAGHRRSTWPVGAVAGLAGGLAEVAWIGLYQHLAGQDAAAVARGVTQSLIPQLTSTYSAVPLGLVIHMGLAVALGIVIAVMVPRLLPRAVGTALEPVLVVATLVAVWAVNFFIVLPAINPTFVSLVPYGASLVSKVLFGFAAAFVFWCTRRQRTVGQQGR